MRIQHALSQLHAIQSQLIRTQCYCCYRWATVAASSFLAALAAAFQSAQMRYPALHLGEYLTLWISVAAASMTIISAEILLRWQHDSDYARRQTIAAVRQFAPCVVAGALLTFAIAAGSPEHGDLLPGLWAICFSLGVFASAAHLPRPCMAVGTYYLTAGLACIVWGQGDEALRPWTMSVTFAMGQALAALALYHRNRQTGDNDRE
jgi:hypothetical protein